MKNKKGILANSKNYGLIFDRFQKFIKRNEGKNIEIKNIWGIPQKREKWDGNPVNYKFHEAPIVQKHFGWSKNECLFGVCPSCMQDIINMHYEGSLALFYRHHPSGIDINNPQIYNSIVKDGDRIFFKNEGIIVIPKRVTQGINEICSWMLVAC